MTFHDLRRDIEISISYLQRDISFSFSFLRVIRIISYLDVADKTFLNGKYIQAAECHKHAQLSLFFCNTYKI